MIEIKDLDYNKRQKTILKIDGDISKEYAEKLLIDFIKRYMYQHGYRGKVLQNGKEIYHL